MSIDDVKHIVYFTDTEDFFVRKFLQIREVGEHYTSTTNDTEFCLMFPNPILQRCVRLTERALGM